MQRSNILRAGLPVLIAVGLLMAMAGAVSPTDLNKAGYLPAGTFIPELSSEHARHYSNGDGTIRAEISMPATDATDSEARLSANYSGYSTYSITSPWTKFVGDIRAGFIGTFPIPEYTGWMEWDITSIPVDAVVSNVGIEIELVSITAGASYIMDRGWRIRSMTAVQPSVGGAQALHDGTRNGSLYFEDVWGTGPPPPPQQYNVALAGVAATHLQTARATGTVRDWFAAGVLSAHDGNDLWFAGSAGANPPVLVVTYQGGDPELAKDMAAVSIDNLPFYVGPGTNQSLQVTVENFGTEAQDGVPVILEIKDQDEFTVFTETINTGEVEPGGTEQVTFNWSVPMQVENYYEVTARTNLAGDEDPTNDAIGPYRLNYESFTEAQFPPFGWEERKVGADGWKRWTDHSKSSPASAKHDYAGGPHDGWLITPGFEVPTGGKLHFWEMTYYSGWYNYSGVWIRTGSFAEPPAGWAELEEIGAGSDGVWREQEISLASYEGQTVWLAFRYQGTGAHDWHVDDVRLTAEEQLTLTEVAPSTGSPGDVVEVTLTGTLFEEDMDVDFGVGIGAVLGEVNVEGTIALVTITIATEAVPGPRDVTVTVDGLDPAVLTDGFTVLAPGAWDQMVRLPFEAGDRRDAISRGSWLAYDGDNLIYAHKGNRNREIYVYDITGDGWTQLEVETPLDTVRNRPTGLGSRAVIVGNELFLVHGNNTGAFWKLSLSAVDEDPWAPWEMLADIPGRIVRGGGDLAYHDGTIYFLKGDRTEFLSYNIGADEWTVEAAAPGNRWLRDSWLAADETGTIYAHMARFFDRDVEHRNDWAHYMYSYTGIWSEDLGGMPLLGPVGRRWRRRRAGEGGSGVYYDGSLYALKGGNTQQLWQYDITGATWQHLDEMELLGADGRRRVNAGGFLVSVGNDEFYALKGNRTNEFWRYTLPETGDAASLPRPDRSGVMAEELPTGQAFVKLGPNPLAGGMATLRYSLPQAGPATVNLFDVTGRNVLSRNIATSQTGSIGLDLRNLSAGIYLLQVEAEGFSGRQKLVIQQ